MIHSNGLYHGANKRYEFNAIQFTFNNGEIFMQEGENLDVSLDMAIELKQVFQNLVPCISTIPLIEYPDD